MNDDKVVSYRIISSENINGAENRAAYEVYFIWLCALLMQYNTLPFKTSHAQEVNGPGNKRVPPPFAL